MRITLTVEILTAMNYVSEDRADPLWYLTNASVFTWLYLTIIARMCDSSRRPCVTSNRSVSRWFKEIKSALRSRKLSIIIVEATIYWYVREPGLLICAWGRIDTRTRSWENRDLMKEGLALKKTRVRDHERKHFVKPTRFRALHCDLRELTAVVIKKKRENSRKREKKKKKRKESEWK